MSTAMRPAQCIRRSSSLASDFSTTNAISTPSSPANSTDSTPTTAGGTFIDRNISSYSLRNTRLVNSSDYTNGERNTSSTVVRNPKLYKTELCRSWLESGRCNYGERCQYAHGDEEKRPVDRHPKYKTAYCQSYHNNGFCPYGPRCHFIHSEEPSRSVTPQTKNYSVMVTDVINSLRTGETDKKVTIDPTTSMSQAAQLLRGNYYSSGESILDSSNNSSNNHSPVGSSSPVVDVESAKILWPPNFENKTYEDNLKLDDHVVFESYLDTLLNPVSLSVGALFNPGLDILNATNGGNYKSQTNRPVASPIYDHQQLPVFKQFRKMSNDLVGSGGN